MRRSLIWLTIAGPMLTACFNDKGNYDYDEINEVTIGQKGFDGDTVYQLRSDVDELKITPDLSFLLGKESSGSYSYEWVAVSTNKRVGERTQLGTERNLDYKVKLKADNYNLFYKVTDEATGIVYSRQATLNVNNLYTQGWILTGEDNDGNMVVDMLSISRDTLHLTDILGNKGVTLKQPIRIWADNSPEIYENQIYVCTENGTYRYGREDFDNPQELTIFDPDVKGYRHSIVMHDIQKISNKRALFLADKYAYSLSSLNEGEFGNPVSYYLQDEGYDYFTPAAGIACNHTGEDNSAAAIEQYVVFNTRDRVFCNLRPMGTSMNNLSDSDTEEAFSWNTKKDFAPNGLTFVACINSLYSGGQSATILQNPANGKRYIYTYTISRQGGVATKGKRYEIPTSATGFYQASLFCITTRQGYLIYADGKNLYGYNFRNGQNPVLLYTFDGDATAIFNDIVTDEKQDDYFYVVTYTEGEADQRGGKLYKFGVTDTADKIEVTRKAEWKGFPRTVDISYKKF